MIHIWENILELLVPKDFHEICLMLNKMFNLGNLGKSFANNASMNV